MREEEETRKSYDIKNRNGSEGSKKFGVDYGTPLPWPQDRPPVKKVVSGYMRGEEETRTRLDKKYGSDGSHKFAVYYGTPPWAQDRPPDEKNYEVL